jgi:hypothetical protein
VDAVKVPRSVVPDQMELHRRMLLWLAERSSDEPLVPCGTCRHDIDDHIGGLTLCMFPATIGAPGRLCHCDSFVELGAPQQEQHQQDDDDEQDDTAADVEATGQ